MKYVTLEPAVLDDEPIEIPIQAVEAGSSGNVPADTIVLTVSSGLSEIDAVTNPQATTGGYDEKSDDELRARIMEYDATTGSSFIGNVADYRRWALSVPSVGDVNVKGAEDDSGTVTIIAVDADGNPASQQLCEDIYDYIMGEDNSLGQRLAPVNAQLRVIAPDSLPITVSATVDLVGTRSLEEVKEAFLQELQAYFMEAMGDGEIKYTKVAAILTATPGVSDFRQLRLGGGRQNIVIDAQEIAYIDASLIALTEGVA